MKPNQPEKFSDDPRENLHIENQILKLKLQAESGAYFSEMDNDIPPEIENDFLKHVQAFEEAFQNVKESTVFELIDRPDFQFEDCLTDDAIEKELERISEIMAQYNIHLDVLGEYPSRVIYKFITEELFAHETADMQLPGWNINFIYEEFHPNHELDIRNRAKEFIDNWMERRFNEYNLELDEEFVLTNGTTLSKKEILLKFQNFFESFTEFDNVDFNISEISFQWNENKYQGLGHAEGRVKYDALMENGDKIHFEGPFKLYMGNDKGWWNIFYFIFPGIEI